MSHKFETKYSLREHKVSCVYRILGFTRKFYGQEPLGLLYFSTLKSMLMDKTTSSSCRHSADYRILKTSEIRGGCIGEIEVLTPAVNFDSRKFKGHFLSSFSSTGAAGGLQRTK